MMPDSRLHAHVADRLENAGYVVVPSFLDAAIGAALANECRTLHAQAKLQPAAIARGRARSVHGETRGDRTCWLEPAASTPAQAAYWSRMSALRSALNRELLLGMSELEAHYALYAPGAAYARHRDRFRDNDARVLSSVLYLNEEWRESDGGALRLYLDVNAAYHDVLPHAGTLVLFLSAEFEHEVLPATRERLSIAGWFRRAQALSG